MSRETKIKTALSTALSTVTYQAAPVPIYDIVRDDVEDLHIFFAKMMQDYAGTKSSLLHEVTIQLGVRHLFDTTYIGADVVDDVGEQIENILETNLSITDYQTVVQVLERSYYAENSNKGAKEIIKVYIYKLIIQKNG